SRPDITFVVGVCARYQAEPNMSHLTQDIVMLIGQEVQMIEKSLLELISFWLLSIIVDETDVEGVQC
ncbi:gag-pol polyprotein, partial [Trifolium medium]|nr:gag-pol polyprotein [Trifolium medium]